MMAEIFGWIGSICFAICTLPQAYLIHKQGHAVGLHVNTIMLYIIACSLSLIYALSVMAPALIFNFGLSLVLWIFMARYKFYPKG